MTTERFLTAEGIGVPAVTAGQMREIDRIALEDTGPNLYQMMENAGRSLALEALRMLEPAQSVVVLAGTGGNGGGGICAARHLANRGIEVSLVMTHPERLDEVPREQLEIYRSTAGRVLRSVERLPEPPDMVIDALIGYSLSGAPQGRARKLIEWANGSEASILALDVPSGLDATTGAAEGSLILAERTLTLALPKTGLDSEAIGHLMLTDIGIPADTYRRAGLRVSPKTFGSSFTVRLEAG